jgi:cobalt-zinc-cadmium resistance protein CzcA
VAPPDKEWLIDRCAPCERFPGVEFGFTQPIEMRVSEMLTGSRGDVAVKIFGPTWQTLGELAQRIEPPNLEQVAGSQDVLTPPTTRAVPADRASTRPPPGAPARRGAVQDELRAQLEGLPAGRW